MNRNQETALQILQEILESVREMTEEAIPPLIQEAGARTQSVLMTVFRTLKRRGYNPSDEVVDALKTAIRTSQLPPLPPPLPSNN